ncbi:hypothetical protein [Neptunomonas qingdaonensis]|uniref:Peptidase M15 n=1 Tax=Neptunomonas qingdaonensis TaxID=1045558 RepID=A0A1I2TUD9_9GAMM|nr:hypothetical protein [Neptunomonas qingdaonensis]SFG68565.1 hypothetical protein SAMN05216175_11127 [Neptunomonas qingdaonensis]
MPKSQESFNAISLLATEILDLVVDEFGSVKLTYGLCSKELLSEIRKRNVKRIAPSLDQHAAFEVNKAGKRICSRDGFACDFRVEGVSSIVIALWVIENCSFDRLYFYGHDLPIHVSYGPELNCKVSVMKQYNGKLVPRTIKKERFLDYVG